ncbi:Uncharacterised protein [uncultured archaeon]|nr:Uncharacterised protein [uncultured archaeon]
MSGAKKNIVAEALNGVLETIYKINPDILLETGFHFETKKVMDMSLTEAAQYLKEVTTFTEKVLSYQKAIGLLVGSLDKVYDSVVEENTVAIEITPEKVREKDQQVTKIVKKQQSQKVEKKKSTGEDEDWEEEEEW